MGRLRLVTVLLLAVGVAMPASASGQARTRDRTCTPPRTKTLVASAQARVFQTRRRIDSVRVTYGCLLRRRRPFRFYHPEFATGFEPIVLAGEYVAYGAYGDCAASFCDPNSVIVQNLRNGRTTFADGPIRTATVTALVLRQDGSVAWIARRFDEQGTVQPEHQVVKAERGGGQVVLDSGTGVVPDSLALAGPTLYWTKDGRAVSALLG